MKKRCMGIDQSYTSTGLVVVREGKRAPLVYDNIKTSTKFGTTDERIQFIIDNIMGMVETFQPDVVAVESLAWGMVGKGQVFQLGELSGAIKAALHRGGVNFHVANIGTWKKWFTGNGNAGKPLVISHALQLWPECPLNTDIADSYGIARWGLDNLD